MELIDDFLLQLNRERIGGPHAMLSNCFFDQRSCASSYVTTEMPSLNSSTPNSVHSLSPKHEMSSNPSMNHLSLNTVQYAQLAHFLNEMIENQRRQQTIIHTLMNRVSILEQHQSQHHMHCNTDGNNNVSPSSTINSVSPPPAFTNNVCFCFSLFVYCTNVRMVH